MINSDVIKNLIDETANLEVNLKETYTFSDKRVPRVTEVLSAMLHNESLMSWSNSLGWKRISYTAFMKEAADKGTYSHLAVEKYIKNGYVDLDKFKIVNPIVLEAVKSCLDGFIKWWNILHETYNKIETIFVEETMIHPYIGGTCDCVLKIDNKYWLIDFKTSNHLNYNYALQLAAYRFLLRETRNIHINQCCVLMLNKVDHSFRTYELDFSNDDHLKFIEDCEQTFLTLVSAYIMRLYTTDKYCEIFNMNK